MTALDCREGVEFYNAVKDIVCGGDITELYSGVRYYRDPCGCQIYRKERGGRMLLLVDEPYANGLSPLLSAWDIQIEPPYASLSHGAGVAIRKTSTTHFGNHPVTVPLTNTRCVFAAPCAVGPLQPGSPGERGDKPAVSGLIFIDPPGAAAYPIAAASELGAGNRMENPANPRLIVCGDSDFISNAVLSSGMEGNLLFFLSSMQWLAGFQRPLPPSLPFSRRFALSSSEPVPGTPLLLL